MAKGIGNGFPFAAVITRKDIADSLTDVLTFNTYSGNPIACAAASAILDVIKLFFCFMKNICFCKSF